MIPAIVNGLRPIAVSDDEWIINAAASGRYGDRRMAAINAGRAVVLLPEDMQGFAGGGRAGGGGMDMDALAAAVARAMPPSVHVEHLHQTDGGPRDIARELAYEARTGRR
jgi:hypothetical protein